MKISLLWSLLTTRGCLTGEIIKCPHSPRPSPAQVRRARVAIHQLCNCCHYYLSTIYYPLSQHLLAHSSGRNVALVSSPHPSLSATPGFSLPLLHSQGLIITPGVPMTLTRDTWHVARWWRCQVRPICPVSSPLPAQPAVISLGTELLHYKCDLLVVSCRGGVQPLN